MDGIRLLIVEDFPEDAEYAAEIAGQLGMTVVGVTTNVAETLEKLSEVEPDCVLLDYRLGQDDGLGLVKAIERRWPYVATVVLSGSGGDYVAASARKAGAVCYLPKRGMDAASLRSAVDEAVRWKTHQRRLNGIG